MATIRWIALTTLLVGIVAMAAVAQTTNLCNYNKEDNVYCTGKLDDLDCARYNNDLIGCTTRQSGWNGYSRTAKKGAFKCQPPAASGGGAPNTNCIQYSITTSGVVTIVKKPCYTYQLCQWYVPMDGSGGVCQPQGAVLDYMPTDTWTNIACP